MASIDDTVALLNPLRLAEEEVKDRFGDRVSVFQKRKRLGKFGKIENLTTATATVMDWPSTGGTETFVSDNLIDRVVSTDAADNQTVTIEGHTVDGSGNFTFVVQQATLNGQTAVTLSTPLARCSRLFNAGATEMAGAISVYQSTSTTTSGVVDDETKLHMYLLAGQQQSFKCQTTFSQFDYFFITSLLLSVNKKTSAGVDFDLEIRGKGGVFRPVQRLSLTSSAQSTFQRILLPPAVISKNSDVRVTATGSTTGIAVTATFEGHIALIV